MTAALMFRRGLQRSSVWKSACYDPLVIANRRHAGATSAHSKIRHGASSVAWPWAIALTVFGHGVSAAPVYQPPGSNLTYGDVTHGQRLSSGTGNPAAAAADAARAADAGDERRFGTVVSAVAGVEFGNVDEFFTTLDELSGAFASTPPDDGDPGGPGDPPAEPPDDGIDIGRIVDICCPDLRALIDRAEAGLKTRLALLTLISVDGYAKGFRSFDVPVITSSDIAGGAWTFGVNWSDSVKAYGIADPTLTFDRNDALEDLENQYDLMPGDPVTTIDLVGDVDLVFDPRLGNVKAVLDNDSTLITKASRTTEVWLGYSRRIGTIKSGDLFVGAEAKFFDLDLSRVGIRFGDIKDSEALFESIRDASYRSDSGFGADFGVLWVTDRYQLGATLTNVNEPTFEYPAVDVAGYREVAVIDRLFQDQSYTMTRQLKLEGSVFGSNRRWSAHLGLDANEAEDPMGDSFQWLTLSSGLSTNWAWLPDFRFGFRRNLAGSELGYLAIGATMFRWFNVDLAVETNRVTIDEDTYPRSAMLSLGFQVEF